MARKPRHPAKLEFDPELDKTVIFRRISGRFSRKPGLVQTRLGSLPYSKNWQNAGIYVGTNQDNYIKVVAGYNGGTGVQLGGEINAGFTTGALSSFGSTASRNPGRRNGTGA